jgi:hypothetical protein
MPDASHDVGIGTTMPRDATFHVDVTPLLKGFAVWGEWLKSPNPITDTPYDVYAVQA